MTTKKPWEKDKDESEKLTLKIPSTYNANEFNKTIKEAVEDRVKDFVVQNDTTLDSTALFIIAENMGNLYGLSIKSVIRAIFLLFLSGAANKGAPDSLAATVKDKDGVSVRVYKKDLIFFYHAVTGNYFLRRFAESFADEISKFAEANNLSGDLARQIDRLIKSMEPNEKGEVPSKLNMKERAWCSSFNQDNITLEKDPELKRVANYLAKDLIRKFSNKNTKIKEKPKSGEKEKENKKNPPNTPKKPNKGGGKNGNKN